MRFFNQFMAVFEAEVKASIRERGPLMFLTAFPFVLSLLTYSVGSVLTGGAAPAHKWFFQLIGFSVMTLSILMTSSAAWYYREGMVSGRLEYSMAAPINPFTTVLANSLAKIIVGLIGFLISGMAGTLIVYGFSYLANTLIAFFVTFIALLPVAGIGLIIGTLTIILKEPEPVANSFTAIISATSGFAYPITLLPTILQLIGKALPFFHVAETARTIIIQGIGLTQLTNVFFLLAYVAVGLIVYRMGENFFARKVGIHW